MKSLLLIALALGFAGCAKEQPAAETLAAAPAQQLASSDAAQTTLETAEATSQAQQEHTIDVAGEFSPASLTIPANTPVRLNFRRSDKPTCAEEIVLPELNMRKKIAANETVTFELPAQPARALTFACGMNMLKGSIVVQ